MAIGRKSIMWVHGNTNTTTPTITAETTFNVDNPVFWTPFSVLSGLASGYCERRAVLNSTFITGASTSIVWNQDSTEDADVTARATVVSNCMHNLALGSDTDHLFYTANATLAPIGSAADTTSNYMTALDSAIVKLIDTDAPSYYVPAAGATAYTDFANLGASAAVTATAAGSSIQTPVSGGGTTLRGTLGINLPVEYAKERKWMLDELSWTLGGVSEDQVLLAGTWMPYAVLSDTSTETGNTYPNLYTSAITDATAQDLDYQGSEVVGYFSASMLNDRDSYASATKVGYYGKLQCSAGWTTTNIVVDGATYTKADAVVEDLQPWAESTNPQVFVYTDAEEEPHIDTPAYLDTGKTQYEYVQDAIRVPKWANAAATLYIDRWSYTSAWSGDSPVRSLPIDYTGKDSEEDTLIEYVTQATTAVQNGRYCVLDGGVLTLPTGVTARLIDVQSGGSLIAAGGFVNSMNVMEGGSVSPYHTATNVVTYAGLYNYAAINYKDVTQNTAFATHPAFPNAEFTNMTVVTGNYTDTNKNVYVSGGTADITAGTGQRVTCVVCDGGHATISGGLLKAVVSSGGHLTTTSDCIPLYVYVMSGGTMTVGEATHLHGQAENADIVVNSGGSVVFTDLVDSSIHYPNFALQVTPGAYIDVAQNAGLKKISYNLDGKTITFYSFQPIADITDAFSNGVPSTPADEFFGDVVINQFNPFGLTYLSGGTSTVLHTGWNTVSVASFFPCKEDVDLGGDSMVGYAPFFGTADATAGRTNALSVDIEPHQPTDGQGNVVNNGTIHFTSYTITSNTQVSPTEYSYTNNGTGNSQSLLGLYDQDGCRLLNAARVYAVNFPLKGGRENHYTEFYVRQREEYAPST